MVVDDFMKAGGTVNGMKNLLEEFSATLSGIGVLVESDTLDERLVDDYVSILKLSEVNERDKQISLTEGNYFQSGVTFLP